MLRKLAIAIAASGAMMSASTIHALGMGDIELDSALNQPLSARIKLLKASELEDWEIKPDLASDDEFQKTGVDRLFFLTNLKFEVIRDGDDVYVDISSDQPVVEPFLNFLVQVDWPNGRLLREYTLLLDPPVFEDEYDSPEISAPVQEFDGGYDSNMSSGAAVASSVVSESSDIADIPDYVEPGAEQVEPEETMLPGTQAPVSQPVAEQATESVYKVRNNDTLWEVAVKLRPNKRISAQQAMLAIQDLNPEAFINGNINRLRKGQELEIPTENQMLARSFDEAVAEVAMQNKAFSERRAQLDATRKDKAIARDNAVDDNRLTLLAGGAATSESDRAASGKVDDRAAGDQSSLANELNLALENLDKSQRENAELRGRLDALEEQIGTLQRLINLKDEQMVALQTGMASDDVAMDVSQGTPESAMPETTLEVPAQETASPESSEDLNFAGGEAPSSVADGEVEDSTAPASTDKAEQAQVATPAAAEPKPKPKPKFVYVPEEVEEEPFDVVAFAFENPAVIGGAVLPLLLALWLLDRRRKKKADEEELPEESPVASGADPLDNIDGDFEDDFDNEFADLDLGDGAEQSFEGFESADTEDASAGLPESLDESTSHEGEDVLGEVEVYMAYNRIEPAKALLEKTLEEQPGRTELRLKLLEVLAEMDDEEAFTEQYDQVVAQGSLDDQQVAEQIKARMSGAGSDDFDMSSEFDGGLGLDESSSSLDLDSSDGELDFDLDGLDLGESASGSMNADTELSLDSGLSLDEGSSDNGMDFSLDLDSSDSELSLDSNESGLDLDLGDDSLEAADGNGMDFDLNLDDANADSDLDLDLGDSSDDLGSDLELDAGLEFESADNEELSLDSGADLDLPTLDDSDSSDLGLDSSLDSSLDFDLDDSSDEVSLDSDLDLELDAGDEISLDGNDELQSMDGDELDLSLDGDLETDLSFDLDDTGSEVSQEVELDLDGDLDSFSSDELEVPSLDVEQADDTALDLSLDDDLPSLSDVAEDSAPIVDGDALPGLDDLDGDLDFLSGTDESETKLDLARAYIDMDDKDGAREILQEVIDEGSDTQKQEASKLMDSLA